MGNKIKEIQDQVKKASEGKVEINGKNYSKVSIRIETLQRVLEANDVKNLPSVFTRTDTKKNKVITKAYLAEEVDVIINEDGDEIVQMKGVKAVGTSEEDRQANIINQTSAVENAETSAIGRMCATLGIHGGEMASANEIFSAQGASNIIRLNTIYKAHSNSPEDFVDRLCACKTKDAVNELLKEEQDFFAKLKSESESEFFEMQKTVTDFRATLPTEEVNNA